MLGLLKQVSYTFWCRQRPRARSPGAELAAHNAHLKEELDGGLIKFHGDGLQEVDVVA